MIDLGAATLLPGLIDCHTHLLENYDAKLGGDDPNMALTVSGMSTAARALLGARKWARRTLRPGITMVRDVGNSGWNGDVALRDAIRAGWVEGPKDGREHTRTFGRARAGSLAICNRRRRHWWRRNMSL